MVLRASNNGRVRIVPSSGDRPQERVDAPRSADGSHGAAGTSDDAFWKAHEVLAQLEGGQGNETADLHMVNAFGTPREWRTMSRIPLQLVHLLAGIHARGLRNGSRFRTTLVENYFLMMRSAEGYGSEQMVRVASARNGVPSGPPAPRGLFSGWFGGKTPPPGP